MSICKDITTKSIKEVLFLSDLDGTLLQTDKTISQESIRILEDLLKKGLQFSIVTARTPCTVIDILKQVKLSLPIGCMNGAVLYDLEKQRYIEYQSISYANSEVISKIFSKFQADVFIHTLAQNGILYIYHDKIRTKAALDFYHERMNLPLKHYEQAPLPKGQETIYFTGIGEKQKIRLVYDSLLSSPVSSMLQMCFYQDIYDDDVYFLEIYAEKASKKYALERLKERSNANYVVAFGDHENDLDMLETADLGIAVENATPNCKMAANQIIGHHNCSSVAKEILKISQQLSIKTNEP